MVPKGWEFKKLSQITEFIKDGTHGTHKRYESGIPMLSAKNITKKNTVCFEDAPYISEKDYNKIHANYIIKSGDILLTVVGTIGRVAIVPKELSKNFTLQRSVAIIRVTENISNQYLMQLFSNDDFTRLLHRKSNSTAQAGIYLGELGKLKILIPNTTEQQKIAKILSTWDKAISTTERLIENSNQQKKALMQQLLTGKKRLISTQSSFSVRDGFAKSKLGELPDDWNLSLIPKFYWFQEGPGVRKHQFTETGVKLLNGTNIQKSRVDLTTTKTHISEDEAYDGYKHFLADSGDLIIACSGISVDRFDEKIAFLEDQHLPLCMNTSTMRFKVKKDVKASLEFLRYFMMSPLFKNQIRRQITGSAQLNFGPSHVDKCYIVLPSYDEQQKISAVLINADKEIDLLEQQLADLQQEKKALMQVLLTGKKRVVV